jgi:glycosyltransferase involved in cell wall biosynthesis
MTELICRLDPRRFAVHVLCLRREGAWLPRVEAHALSVTAFPVRSLKSPATFGQMAAIARWLRREGIQVVHSCDLYANIIVLPAAALARVPVRIGSRRGIASPVAVRGMLPLQRLAFAAAHIVVANSNAAAAQVAHEGVAARNVTVIPNGIDLGALPPIPYRTPMTVVTTVANLRRGKGHDVLLRAAARVLARNGSVRFRLVGDGPLRPALEEQARELGIASAVEFAGHRDDVAAVLQASDAFAFPSLMEAFPNGLMEAMAVGLPVVATSVGGIPELVSHDETGLLVKPGDAHDLADGILRLLDQPARARAYGEAARRAIASRYSFERMVGDFDALYVAELAARTGRVGKVLPIRSSAHL